MTRRSPRVSRAGTGCERLRFGFTGGSAFSVFVGRSGFSFGVSVFASGFRLLISDDAFTGFSGGLVSFALSCSSFVSVEVRLSTCEKLASEWES